MDSTHTSRRLRNIMGRLAVIAAALPIFALPARADLIDERNEMIAKFVNEMHADPLVADCAAHGNFIASTSNVIDHVDFPPEAFDAAHAAITPWNGSFDQGKQRVTVDHIVTVEGQGIARESAHAPYPLKFRCGYVGNQMLAFSWNDPEPAAKPSAPPSGKKKGKGKHGGKSTTQHSAHKKAAKHQ